MPNIEDLYDDSEPLDENDPEIEEEFFEIDKLMGVKPEDLTGATEKQRAKYAAWLESQKDLSQRG